MGFTPKSTVLSLTVLACALSLGATRVAFADEDQKAQGFAAQEITDHDWSKAEKELLTADVASEDQVFAKLNLAFVYSTTGRRDQAVALYKEILEGSDNPYALTNAGKPRRVKSIAKLALARLSQD